MAVIISDAQNPSYDGNLSTTNGWYRVESYNLGGCSSTAVILSTPKVVNLTFANAGTLKGISVAIGGISVPTIFKDTITLTLKTSGSVTQTVSVSGATILGNTPPNTDDNSFYMVPFVFDTPVLTTTGIYTLEISNSGAQVNNWRLPTTNGTAPIYVAWCDNAVSATSGADTLCINDPVVVNTNFTTYPVLGTGNTEAVSMLVMSSPNRNTPDSVCNLSWDNPAASYTLSIDANILTAADGGIRMGTAASPIPFANQSALNFLSSPSLGTSRGITPLRYSNVNAGKSSLICHGEVPSNRMIRTVGDASSGQASIVLATVPSTWQAGDKLFLPKLDRGGVLLNTYEILSVAGTTVTLTTNLPNNLIANCPVLNLERYGCKLTSANVLGIKLEVPNNFTLIGTLIENLSFVMRSQAGQNKVGITNSTSKYLFEDSFYSKASTGSMVSSFEVPGNGVKFNRFYSITSLLSAAPSFTYGGGAAGGPFENSGIFEVVDCIVTGSPSGASGWNLGGNDTVITGNEIYLTNGNSTASQSVIRLINFINGTFTNNYFWNITSSTPVDLVSVFNPIEWSGNTYENTLFVYQISGQALGIIASNETFINTSAFVVVPSSGAFADFQIEDSNGVLTVNETRQTDLVYNNNGAIRVVNDNNVPNVDKIWQKNGYLVRTGTSLGDTTVHNSGFALRFENNNNINFLTFPQDVPTGNIQNKTMVVGVWVKLNSANYYAGAHTMPRLSVNYDNGTTIFAAAAQTTDWQFIAVPFTPTTTFGRIRVTLATKTLATGSDSYVYFDDMSVLYPAGHTINLGNFDLWANALPIVPSISTTISAQDVWAADPTQFGADTIGEKLNKIKNETVLISALL